MTFLSSSLAAGALILLTALVRRFAGSRLPRRMYIALWDIAVLRLLIPVGLPRTDGAFAAYVQTSAFVQPLQAETVTADMVDVQALSSTTETGFQLSETVRVALLVIWVAVALGLALYFIAAYIRSTRAFAQFLPDDDPRCAAFLQAHPIRRRVQIRLSSRIASPLSYGLLHPVILLPKGMNRDGLLFVLEHEMMHIRALDAWRKLLVLAALCLHWFNPAVFLLFLLVNRDMELLCDERVLSQCATSSKRAYALTLLEMEAARSAAPTMSCFRMTGIEERIFAMKNIRKNTPLTRLVAGSLVAASCFAMMSAVPAARTTRFSSSRRKMRSLCGRTRLFRRRTCSSFLPTLRRILRTATSFITKKRPLPNPTSCLSSGGQLTNLKTIWRRRAKTLKRWLKQVNAATQAPTAGSPGRRKKLRKPWPSMKKCWPNSNAA